MRFAFLVLAAVSMLAAPSAGAREGATPGAAELRAMLVHAGVPLARGTHPAASAFPAAWAAFEGFARIPAGKRGRNLEFEYGVFESHDWGTSFEVELTSQYGRPGGDLRRVHLVLHFPVAAFIAITRELRAEPCLPGAACVFRCFFAGDDVLVPRPCKVAPRGAPGYRVGDMTLTASQAGGSARWTKAVESSPVFRALLARHVRPVGLEVWEEP